MWLIGNQTMNALFGSHMTKCSGREVVQAGKKFPIPENRKTNRAPPLNVFSDNDPDVAQRHKDIARELGMTVAQLLGKEDIPIADVAWKFSLGKPLVRPEQVRHLPTQMRRLHERYMEFSKEG